MDFVKKNSEVAERDKILFTGDWERMIDNVLQHLPNSLMAHRCPAIDLEIEKAIRKFEPEVLVICLAADASESVRSYYKFSNNADYARLPIVVLGHEEDCELFRKRINIKHLSLLPRPIELPQLESVLHEQAQAYRTRCEKKASAETAAAKPAAPKPAVAEPAPASEPDLIQKIQKDALQQGRKNILVVDDDVLMLNTIKMYLQDLYDVTLVPSGKLALKYLQKRTSDLVLLDYMMPEMDGPEVLRKIRETTPRPNTPVLFLTSVSDKELVLRGLEYNPSGYLLKPVSREVLLERVTEILLGL